MVIVVVTGELPSLKWLLLIPVLLMLTVFNAGLAMAFARLGAKVTDLKQIVPFFLRTWLYGSGVFFSLANVTKNVPDWLATLLYLNPMVAFIELSREALLGDTPAPAVPISQLWLTALGWTIVAGLGGYIYFWRGEKEYGRG
jgi:teichoic acid transport system permease protein